MIILFAVNDDKLALRLMRCISLKLPHIYLDHFTFTPVSIDAEKTTQNINTFGIKGPVAPKMWNKFTIHRIIGLMKFR